VEQSADIPIYVQLISGTILGVALGNLLTGSVRFVQQPKTHRFNILHGLWIVFILFSTFIFWWQEALTFSAVTWTFYLYLFQIAYCSTFLFMTAMLLPDNVSDYGTHYDYFIARRHWFYGSIILTLLLDIGNVTIKYGWNDVVGDPTYIGLSAVSIALLLGGMATTQKWVHVAIASAFVGVTIWTMVP
jgi:hypothetical protein